MVCSRCGAQNPAGNQFCQACGTPLTSAAAGVAAPTGPAPPLGPPSPPGPPPAAAQAATYSAPLAYASPPATPAVYQSPYYAPRPGAVQAPAQRTPWVVIISVVVVLVLVMSGIGTAIAIIGSRTSNLAGSGLSSGLSSPNPAGSPSPVGSPIAGQGSTASNPGVTVPIPSGWSVANKDSESITLDDPNNTGAVTVASGLSNPAQSAQQNKDTVDRVYRSKYPDAKPCPGTQATTSTLNGAAGIIWEVCFTMTSGGQSLSAASSMFAGANSDGTVYYLVQVLTEQGNLSSFVSQAKPILQGVIWKLT
jgi:hypothetical protein